MINCRIGTEYLDLLDGARIPIAVTKAISKIGEIDKRHGDLSIGFDVAWTSKNVKLLNYVTVLNGSTTNESFKKVLGQLVEDDVVISDGFYRVESFNQYDKKIKVRFFGGNSDWFSDIKGYKINESYVETGYDVSDLIDLSFSSQNIVNSFNTELGHANPYKFFLVDNNKDSTRNLTNETILDTFVDDYQVGFSQGVIFDRIFESIGVKTQGNLFNDAKFYNTIISGSKALPQPKSDEFNYSAQQTEDEQRLPNIVSGNLEPLTFSIGDPINEFDGRQITAINDATGLFVQTAIQCRTENADPSKVDLNIEVRNETQSKLIDSTTLNNPDRIPLGTNGSVTTDAWEYFYELDLPSESINAGDVITIKFATEMQGGSTGYPQSYWGDMSRYGFNDVPYFFFSLNNYIKQEEANLFLPDINQDVFVKDVLSQFGVVTQYDAKTKTLTCNKLDLIENRKIYAPDWSDKIDLSKTPNVNLTKLIENYGKRSFFRYSENDESDTLNKLYSSITNYRLGSGAINIDNDFLDDDKDIYESPYSPTINVATFPRVLLDGQSYQIGNLYLPFVPIYTYNGSGEEPENNDLNPRKFIYIDTFTVSSAFKGNVTTINVNDGVSDVQSTILPLVYFDKDDYPDFDNSTLNQYTESLSFGTLRSLTNNTFGYGETRIPKTTLLEENYVFQNKILNKPIYLEIYLRLSPLDVQNVDFFTPIYLSFDLDSGYYYIDEISQYKGQDQSTKVKLVKI